MRRSKILSLALVLISVALTFYLGVRLILRTPGFGGTPEFENGHFKNNPPQIPYGLSAVIQDIRNYSGKEVRVPPKPIPVRRLPADFFKASPAPGLRAVWFGHATVLVELDGLRLLTDPVFAERASPFSFIGPKRFHPTPAPLTAVEKIDAVVISHDHFDHLDAETCRHLANGGTEFYVGLGIGSHLKAWGVSTNQIHEMAWWETRTLKGVAIHCTPARHYSGRRGFEGNNTLWSSWTFVGPQHRFYFSGDTGYAGHFAEIGKKFGPFDLTAIKIGAYGKTWLDIHMDPESAVRAHRDLMGKVMLPVHWGTFNMSYHAWDEPIQRTLVSAKSHSVALIAPRPGDSWSSGAPFQNTNWWE